MGRLAQSNRTRARADPTAPRRNPSRSAGPPLRLQISLHIDACEPALVLPTNAPEPARLGELERCMDCDRGRLGAAYHRDDRLESVGARPVEKSREQRFSHAASRQLRIDVDAVLRGEAVGSTIAELGDVGVASDA